MATTDLIGQECVIIYANGATSHTAKSDVTGAGMSYFPLKGAANIFKIFTLNIKIDKYIC